MRDIKKTIDRYFKAEFRLHIEPSVRAEDTEEAMCDHICQSRNPEQYICFGQSFCRRTTNHGGNN